MGLNTDESMNIRERYLATFRFKPYPRTPRWEMGYWAATIQRWYEEGLPSTQQAMRAKQAYGDWVAGPGQAPAAKDVTNRDQDVAAYFNMDKGAVAVAINSTVCPLYETVVEEETDEYIIIRGSDGIIYKELKAHPMTIHPGCTKS